MILTKDNYISKAEKTILKLKGQKDDRGREIPMVTTSKIRNILAMAADIYNEVLNYPEEKLSEDICERIDYLQIRIVYEYGRDSERTKPVRDFIDTSELLGCIKEIGGSKKNYILFNRYIEALVAYHKFNNGKES